MLNTLVIGNGGRESAIASRLSESSRVSAILGHLNPSIVDVVYGRGGSIHVGNVHDPSEVVRTAKQFDTSLAIVSSDGAIAAGVADALREAGIPTVGASRAAARVEWDKAFGREVLMASAPEAAPLFWVARSLREVERVFKEAGERPLVIKPAGLTGGKGVKVMGVHLADLEQARAYAREIIQKKVGGEAVVVIEEKVSGVEFTIQCITDGETIIFPPATYDYPYRYEEDRGPGTGGMGAYSLPCPQLPFMTESHYLKACRVVELFLLELSQRGLRFNGVLNPGFFVTPSGDIKVIEFNARFGDPECMNIMALLDSDPLALMEAIAHSRLDSSHGAFKKLASLCIYLVSPEYPYPAGEPHNFTLNIEAVRKHGVSVHFSSAIARPNSVARYVTTGSSRTVAFVKTAATLSDARRDILMAIQEGHQGPLEYRSDIASPDDIGRTVASILG